MTALIISAKKDGHISNKGVLQPVLRLIKNHKLCVEQVDSGPVKIEVSESHRNLVQSHQDNTLIKQGTQGNLSLLGSCSSG